MSAKSKALPSKKVKPASLLAGAILIGIIVIGYCAVYKPLTRMSERHRFISAEQNLNNVLNKVEHNAGVAIERNTTRGCSRPHMKYNEGPLGCFVEISLSYQTNNPDGLKEKVFDTLGTPSRNGSTTSSMHIFYQDLPAYDNLSCTLAYEYPGSPDSQNTTSAQIKASCSGKSKAQLF